MTLKFLGNYRKLRKCVARTKFDGVWRELANGLTQYRTLAGPILNWWESSGTINFQGRDPGRVFEKEFMTAADAKQRLARNDGRQTAESIEHRSRVRKRMEQAKADIARLRWRALRNESPVIQNLIAERLDDVAKMIKSLI